MTELAKLFAIKLLIKDLKYSKTSTQKILEEIESMIEYEKSHCTEEYAKRLQDLNILIDKEI